jgi:hypothetical protein
MHLFSLTGMNLGYIRHLEVGFSHHVTCNLSKSDEAARYQTRFKPNMGDI